MKNFVVSCLLCVVLFLCTCSFGVVFAFSDEHLEFYYNNKVFTYSLSNNIKHSYQFDINYEINKLKRFSSYEERKSLLSHLIKIGIDSNIAVNYLFPNISKKINLIEKNIFTAPKNAKLKINADSEKVFTISKEVVGKKLNVNKLYENIIFAYLNNKPLKFNIPIIETYPTISEKNYLEQTSLRSDFSTSIANSSNDRKHNIKNALLSLNKVELKPNETFSFNKIVGKRTESNGYRNAKIIVNNEFVEGIGGGVCQVSSTLYNAALLAGLEIVEANKHSKQVSYVKYGFDAMVNFGSSDLKFKNNTNNIITIITNFSNNKIRVRIFGKSLNGTSYKLTNKISDIVEPSEDVVIDHNNQYSDKVMFDDEFFYLKTANKGMTVASYRETYFNNELISSQLLRQDKYKVQNAVKVFGSKPREVINPSHLYDAHSLQSWII